MRWDKRKAGDTKVSPRHMRSSSLKGKGRLYGKSRDNGHEA
jgi:hypothetical protein